MSYDLLTGRQDGCDLSLHMDLDDSIGIVEDVLPVVLETAAKIGGVSLGGAGLALFTAGQVLKEHGWPL